ncbi:uncharacterized protein K460DRAFT_396511 [Cucurbitaria berberidis CBS 394.84]|uniref:Uncharacterized protein n=1 Tax=Cucurbitaria berberidis CBS 394.84 TaxID=1168544 RepID=A0A9P4L694_9PLEO|nr:uncharacterized protein K460DRAFT_396511 [Cucurbitaria berberidis CBS 394.84]KAF1843127.1 hypothetical protein K460DRAFT_396511 [Cucurbitaria berberidis CBS 394.84]
MPKSHNLGLKRKPHQQFGAAIHAMAGAQSQAQTPRTEFQVKGRSRATYREPLGRRDGGDTRHADRREHEPLKNRITRNEEPQEVLGSQIPREQNSTTRKRGRLDQAEQQPNKRMRMSPIHESSSALEETRKELVHEATAKAQKAQIGQVPLAKQSEEERRALRAKRFAPRKEQARAAAVYSYASSKEAEKHVTTKESEVDRRPTPMGTPTEPSSKATTASANSKTLKESTKKHTPTATKGDGQEHTSLSSAKRARTEDAGFEEHLNKKPRLAADNNCHTSSQQTSIGPKTKAKAKVKEIPGQNTGKPKSSLHGHANQVLQKPRVVIDDDRKVPEPDPDNKPLDFFDYDEDSVPILYSNFIEHNDMVELSTEPSLHLRQGALALLRRPNWKWTSSDFGREDVPKHESTRIIDDCDLYFRNGKVHVATERGLLLAADYFKLIGVPDTQPIRFNGKRPAWTKPIESKRHYRHVEESCMPSEVEQSQGLLEIISGSTVMVFERVSERFEENDIELAYGMRLDTGAKGWFPYDNTCPIGWGKETAPEPETKGDSDKDIIDWTTFSYARLAAAAAAMVTAAVTQATSLTQTLQSITAQSIPPLVKAPASPVSAPTIAPEISIDGANVGSTTDESSTVMPQQKKDTGAKEGITKTPEEADSTLTKSDDHELKAPCQQMESISTGSMNTPTEEEKFTGNETIDNTNDQEPQRAHDIVDQEPQDGLRHDSHQPEPKEKDEAAEKDESSVWIKPIAEKDTIVEQIMIPSQTPVVSQHWAGYEDEDIVDYSDSEL